MSDPVPSGTPVVPPAAPVTALPTPPGSVPPPQYVTLDQFNSVMTRLEGISGKISGIESTVKKVTPASPPAEPQNQTLEQQFAAFRKERDETNVKLAEKARQTEINAAINGIQGIDDISRKLLKSFVKEEYGASIVNEGESVVYIAPDQSRKTLDALMADVMAGVGKRFLLPPTLPGGSALAGGGNKGMPAVKPTYEQMMADTKLLMQMQEADPEYVVTEQNKALANMRTVRK